MPRRLATFWDDLIACRDDVPRLLDVIAQRAAEVVGEASVLATLSDDGELLVPSVVHHPDPETAAFIRSLLGSTPYRIGEGIAGGVALHREPAVVSFVSGEQAPAMSTAHAAAFEQRTAIHALLIVPMIAFGEIVGTLGVMRTQSEEPYDDDDVLLMETLAERAALAVADATRRPAQIGPAEYEAMFRQSVDGVLLTIPDGRVLAANPAACEILGRSETDICRFGRSDLFPMDDPRVPVANAQRAIAGKVRAEVPMRRGDGELFIADVSSAVFATEDGSLRALIVFRDVTDRVHAEEQLRTQHRYLELLHEVTTAINEAVDVDEAIEHTVRAVVAATDWSCGGATLVAPDGSIAGDVPATVVTSGRPTWTSGDGGARVGVPIMVGAEVRGALEFRSDHARAVDDQELGLLEGLGTQLGRVLERAEVEAVRRRVEADRSAFIERAAHEMRSPVASLAIAAELLTNRLDVEGRDARLLGIVSSGAHHLARLVERLLDLSEIERGRPDLQVTAIDLVDVVARAVEAEPAPPGHVVTVAVAPGTCVLADDLAVQQVIGNLLRNAYRHGGAAIAITTRDADGHVELAVCDDGPGVDASIRDTLFEPFVRGPARDVEGVGLGLALSRRLVAAMDGALRYEPAEDGGSRFVIRLPAAPLIAPR